MHLTAEGLAARGHAVGVFTVDDVPAFRRTARGYLDSSPCRRALRARLDADVPDVVHLHNIYHVLSPGILAELDRWRRGRECRVVMTAHDYHLVCPNAGLRFFRGGSPHLADLAKVGQLGYLMSRGWDHRGRRYALLKLMQHVWHYQLRDRRRAIDMIVCPSRFMQSVLNRFGLPTVFVPNPAPPPGGRRAKPGGPLRLVFAGRVDAEKGLAEFLRVLPDTFAGTFEIIGDGAALADCRAVVESRGLGERVTFTGRLPRDETITRIDRAHVVVLPSLWYENAPVALLEALSCGANLLVSNLGGMREIVESAGVGYPFEPGDEASLAAAFERIDRAYDDGRLNAVDASAFLEDRSEANYFKRLVTVYEGG